MTYNYECKFPHKGASWHLVEAKNIDSARKKLAKGSRYESSQIIARRVT
jgi:hypothetical protein